MKIQTRLAVLVTLHASLLLAARAGEPVFKVIDTPAEILGGEASGIEVDLAGRMSLGPRLEPEGAVPEPVILCVASDKAGHVYAGTGHGGKVLSLPKGKGEAAVILDADEMEVTALAVDGSGNVYAATSPDGKVYRIEPDAGAKGVTTFFDPEDRYIWALAWQGSDLLVGTGSPARVHRVDKSGHGSVLFTSPSARNVTALAVVGSTVFAASDGNAKVYRVAEGKGFALFGAPQKEIVALVAAPDGSLYAAASDFGRPSVGGAALATPAPAMEPPGATAEIVEPGTPAAAPTPPPGPSPAPAPQPAGIEVHGQSQIVRLAADGSGAVETIFSSAEEAVTALCLDAGGSPYFAAAGPTGGRVYRRDKAGRLAIVASLSQGIASALGARQDGAFIVASSNPARLALLDPRGADRGTLAGPPLDAGATARFGSITYHGDPAARLTVRTRTGNTAEPGPDWSAWSEPLPDGARIPGGPARYLQWKVEMTAGPGPSPWLEGLTIPYLQKNLPPTVDTVTVLEPGIVYRLPSAAIEEPGQPPPGDEELFAQNVPSMAETGLPLAGGPHRLEFRRGLRTIAWTAKDANGDKLAFDLAYRPEDGSSSATDEGYLPLKADVRADFYTFDTTSLPDGVYRIRVTASDRPSNPVPDAVQSASVSQAFAIDNTPPRVTARDEGDALVVRATDSGQLAKALVSVDSGRFVPVVPEDGMTDGKEESYRIRRADLGAAAEHPGALVLFKAFDRAGNVGAASVRLSGR